MKASLVKQQSGKLLQTIVSEPERSYSCSKAMNFRTRSGSADTFHTTGSRLSDCPPNHSTETLSASARTASSAWVMTRAADLAGASCRFIRILERRSRVRPGTSRSSFMWIAARLHLSDNWLSFRPRNFMREHILLAAFFRRTEVQGTDCEAGIKVYLSMGSRPSSCPALGLRLKRPASDSPSNLIRHRKRLVAAPLSFLNSCHSLHGESSFCPLSLSNTYAHEKNASGILRTNLKSNSSVWVMQSAGVIRSVAVN